MMRWTVAGGMLLLAVTGCTITWKSGPMGTFKQSDYTCKRDAEGVRRSFTGLLALAEDARVRKLYIECMEAQGYSRT